MVHCRFLNALHRVGTIPPNILPPANDVCEGYVFACVCLSGGGGIPACLAGLEGGVSQHALQVSRPVPREELEGSAWGGGLQAHTRGGEVEGSRPTPRGRVSQHALRQTPPRRLLLGAVRILLECILVSMLQVVTTGIILVPQNICYLVLLAAS